jgi:hypothetical protein
VVEHLLSKNKALSFSPKTTKKKKKILKIVVKSTWRIYQGLTYFSVKSQKINILGCADYMVSVLTIQLC